MSLELSALGLYEDNNKFRSNLWPKFVYTYESSYGNEKNCATKCAIRETACHFYYHSGSDCYFGDFTRHTNPHYLGETNGPFKALKSGFGKFSKDFQSKYIFWLPVSSVLPFDINTNPHPLT